MNAHQQIIYHHSISIRYNINHLRDLLMITLNNRNDITMLNLNNCLSHLFKIKYIIDTNNNDSFNF